MRSFPAFSYSTIVAQHCFQSVPAYGSQCAPCTAAAAFTGVQSRYMRGRGFGSGAASLGFGSHTGGFAPASKPIRITMASLCYALLHFIGHAGRIPPCCTVCLCTNASMTMELLGEERGAEASLGISARLLHTSSITGNHHDLPL